MTNDQPPGRHIDGDKYAIRSEVMDLSAASPEIFAALSKAQGEVETVGKDGTNDQRGYGYATAEAMIRGSRGPLSANGLAYFSSWDRDSTTFLPGGDIGQQFVSASVRIHWVCSHASGGYIRGTSVVDAIGSRARPPDKAMAATLTYGHGFILRDLLNMDRGQVDPDEVVDQRPEPKPDPRWDAFQSAVRRLAAMRKVEHDAAYAMVRVEAEIQPGKDGPTDPQLVVLTEVAERMAKPQPSPMDRLNRAVDHLAKKMAIDASGVGKLIEKAAGVELDGHPTPAQVVTLMGEAERMLSEGQNETPGRDGWIEACRELLALRRADYKTAEGESPSEKVVKEWRAAIQTESGVDHRKATDAEFAEATAKVNAEIARVKAP